MTLVPASSRSSAPSGAAGGDLTGTYPDPTVAAAKITAAKMSSGAAAAATVATADGAGGVSYAAVSGGVSSATFSLTAAQLKAAAVVPVTVVVAPGANKVLLPTGGVIEYIFVTTPYNAGQLDFYVNDVTQAIGGQNSVINQAASQVVGIGGFYSPHDTFPRATFANAPLLMRTRLGGAIVTSSLNSGGALYAINDTGTVDANYDAATGATYRVDSVDGGGAVLTYTITAAGTGYDTGNPANTTPGGGQPGIGAGFAINILTINPAADPGDGTLAGTIYYFTVTIP